MEVPHQSHSFKGSHYIPVSKTEAFYGIAQALHARHPSLSFMIFFSFNLSSFQVNHRTADGFLKRDVERGAGQDPVTGWPPLSAVSRLWLGPKFSTKWFPWRAGASGTESHSSCRLTCGCIEVFSCPREGAVESCWMVYQLHAVMLGPGHFLCVWTVLKLTDQVFLKRVLFSLSLSLNVTHLSC